MTTHREAEGLGALQLVGEGIHRLGPGGVGRRGEIDQIARVGEDVADPGERPRQREGARLLGRERLRRPLTLVLQEELHRAAADRPPALEGAVEAPRDRHVGAELVPALHPSSWASLMSR